MRPKQRIRKIYTESDIGERPLVLDENGPKASSNINIRDLELNLSDGNKSLPDTKNGRSSLYKNAHFYMPNKFNKINRKQLIKKLPEINLASLNTISKPMKLTPLEENNKLEERFSSSNKKNTFLLSSVFGSMFPNGGEVLRKETNERNELSKLKERSLKLGQKKHISIDSFYENQFINVANSSTKNRGPKVIENEITRLSSHNNIMRRKIVSQEKSRPKYVDHSIERLKQTTFEHFKRCVQKDQNEFQPVFSNQPKQNFQNLEIITFYNKFPNLKKHEEKPGRHLFGQEANPDKDPKNYRAKLKTEQPEYEEENEFIFDKH